MSSAITISTPMPASGSRPEAHVVFAATLPHLGMFFRFVADDFFCGHVGEAGIVVGEIEASRVSHYQAMFVADSEAAAEDCELSGSRDSTSLFTPRTISNLTVIYHIP